MKGEKRGKISDITQETYKLGDIYARKTEEKRKQVSENYVNNKQRTRRKEIKNRTVPQTSEYISASQH